MKTPVEVTVVVIYHNEEGNLQALLDSFGDIKGTGLESRFQFLFIDNNSHGCNSSGIVEKVDKIQFLGHYG